MKQINSSKSEQQNLITFTHFRTSNGNCLTKGFSLGPDGTLRKESHAQPSSCIAWTKEIKEIEILSEYIDTFRPNDAIALGVFEEREVQVVSRSALSNANAKRPLRTRTLDSMRQPCTGLGLFDHDPSPLMPQELRCRTPTELMHLLARAVPELKNISWVGRGSSSQGIFNENTGERFEGSGGVHVYFGLKSTDLASLRKFLEVALWRAGMGYVELARNGRRLNRTIIDLTVLSPERLIFEAPPILGPGVGRVAPAWEYSHG